MGRGDPPGNRDDDRALWSAVKASVKPIRRDTVAKKGIRVEEPAFEKPHTAPTAKKARPRIGVSYQAPDTPKRPQVSASPLTPGATPGIDRRTAERFRRGKLSIDGRVDLHGMSREAAHGKVVDYLLTAHGMGKRCVVVVTGKGRGILKESVPHWLNLPPLRDKILAFSPARPEHGGDGALYVLLKRRRDT